MHIQCIACGEKYRPKDIIYVCKKCGNILDVRYDYEEVSRRLKASDWRKRPLGVWKYKELLPVLERSRIITLNEGGTNLYHCKRLGSKLGLRNLYVKNEGENPTGSFKDRGMTVGVTKAIEFKSKIVGCASTGNTSASLAAYAAKAGLSCIILIPSGKIAYGKLAQSIIYGAKIIQVRGNFDQALKIIIEISEKYRKIYLLNSINPYRLEGQKTLAYEVYDQLGGKAPDKVVVPVGNAGNISAIWKGFSEFQYLGFISELPQMYGVQAEGAAPIARAIKEGRNKIKPVANPETIATAIRIGAPVSWEKAIRAIHASKGSAEIVSDKEILEAQKMLARYEGLFVEPSSAASIAGLRKLVNSRKIDKGDVVVCVATGHGLKDPDIVIKSFEEPIEADAKVESVEKVLGV